MGLEVNEDNIQKLVEEHGQELTTDELVDLHHEQQQEVIEEISSAEEEEKRWRNPSLQVRLGKCGKQRKIL
ncbi:Hypothetical predicted protein [Lynx pardinus]|uniref:Uncharacterized protein n=1 Tax=Lynx pardinus TaxID=191816 RepID=A0A485MJ12_LYNPA|nr:Hypothetical predicted protein [Lynx pardinus]